MVDLVQVGRPVTVTVDALDQRKLGGRVRSVALEPRRNADGDDHYLAIIDLDSVPSALRIGMTVRVTFGE